MKTKRHYFMYASILFMLAIWGFIAFEKGMLLFKGLNLAISILIIGVGVLALLKFNKKEKERAQGIPKEDEFTLLIKYKTGHIAYMASMYMWLFIFLLKDKFPTIESIIGGGVLLSALIYYVSKIYVKKSFNE